MSISENDLAPVLKLLAEVKNNLTHVQREWTEVQKIAASSIVPKALSPDDVIVSKASLHKLAVECEQMRSLMPRMSCRELASAATQLPGVEAELSNIMSERDSLLAEVGHWKTQLDEAVNQAQKDKQVSLNHQMDAQELTRQLCDQSEFCSHLGATLATLLWRLSRQEDAVAAVVAGPKLSDLLSLSSSCIGSFLEAYKDDQWPEQTSDEASFILALTGIFTNIAASAVGREQLSSNQAGLGMVDTLLTFLSDAPSNYTAALKSLMLTGLYNLSINQKGAKYLCSRQDLMQKLTSILESLDSTQEHQVNVLRLLQSLMADDDAGPSMLLQLREQMSLVCLQNLARSSSQYLRELALDLLSDIRHMDKEP